MEQAGTETGRRSALMKIFSLPLNGRLSNQHKRCSVIILSSGNARKINSIADVSIGNQFILWKIFLGNEIAYNSAAKQKICCKGSLLQKQRLLRRNPIPPTLSLKNIPRKISRHPPWNGEQPPKNRRGHTILRLLLKKFFEGGAYAPRSWKI